jgi:hypothetical protein
LALPSEVRILPPPFSLAREAVAIIERTDGLNFQGDALCDLAEVLTVGGRSDEAAAALTESLDRYERKPSPWLARCERGSPTCSPRRSTTRTRVGSVLTRAGGGSTLGDAAGLTRRS